ncbi:MAG: efflux RND transporter permease subunit [Pseudomonadales bacterium]|nr:efflux RND transporter permease subunit [Pseudomonadales bacterium]
MKNDELAATGIIAWFTRNSVAANLLMLSIVLLGLVSYGSINKKMFPEFDANSIQVRVAHLGAAPDEVEQSVILKIEDALENLEGIKKVTSTAREGLGTVIIELQSGYSVTEKLSEVQMQIDGIATFPQQAEKPVITKKEMPSDVLWVSVYGAMDQSTRQRLSQQIRDEIMDLPGVNIAELVGNMEREISIEISSQQLRQYGLSFDEVSQAVNKASIDMPGGSIKTQGGDILLRTQGQAYTGADYAQLVLRTDADGTRLLLGDVANIIDGFEEGEGFAHFDRENTSSIRVKSTGDQNDLAIAATVKEYVNKRQASLPNGAYVSVWGDSSVYLDARLDMMMDNMLAGAFLVFLVLALFLRVRVAFWVMVGIPVCFLGAFILMPLLGSYAVSVNMLSLFAFIMVLGIVVDDAIVIAESVYSEVGKHGHSVENVIRGANKVAMPATFGVLTTIAAFIPLILIDTSFSPFFHSIAIVVTCCLMFSLVESKWILPAHLAHTSIPPIDEGNANVMQRFRLGFKNGLDDFIITRYKPALLKALQYRYNTIAMFIGILIVSMGLMAGSLVKVEIFPNVPSDFLQGNLTMVEGASSKTRNEVLIRVENAIYKLSEEYENTQGTAFIDHSMVYTTSDTGGGFFVELTGQDTREINAYEIEKMWREEVGDIPGVKDLRIYSGANIRGGADLEFQFIGSDIDELDAAAQALQKKLAEYDGVVDIRNSFNRGKQEIKLHIKPEAEAFGITLADLGKQVRQAFYGEEAQRIQRGRDEIKVMLRYPQSQRLSIDDLENMWIRTPDGDEVPFYQVADFTLGEGFSAITRVNRKRSITISADINNPNLESRKVVKEVREKILPAIFTEYPTVQTGDEGASREEADFMAQMAASSLGALFLIYCLIAIPTRSYAQPLVIMSVIPFGIVGAIWGHLFLGMSLNMLSMYGLIALSGVVVNDSLIMVDFINKEKARGGDLLEAVVNAGTQRFRAILLTSLTTFFGLLPIYFETSMQAQFIIPMAVSLGFGILFATLITLFLIPALYIIQLDIKSCFSRKALPINLIKGANVDG